MVLSENKANPIVDLLLKNAVEQIKTATNTDVAKSDIEEQLFDCEWLFAINIDDEENFVDFTQLVKQLDYIIERNIKYILDEKEAENNVNF